MGYIKTLALLTWAALMFTYPGPSFAQAPFRPYKSNELLVKYKTDDMAARSALNSAARVHSAHAIGNGRIHRIILEPDMTVDQALEIYAANPDVEFVEPNYILRTQAFPNDTSFSQLWGLNNTGQIVSGYVGTPGADMDAAPAWDITTGSTDVIVAVIDTGSDIDHPDLAANIWTNPGEIADDGIDNDGNGFIDDVHGWDFADGDNDPRDASGHGTHVAGIAGAVTDNNRGIAGVAWEVRIMPVRFLNAFDEGTTSDAIDAIQYAVNQGAKIINCSWGGAGYSASLRNVMANANALFICAAGNNGVDADVAPYYPAAYNCTNIISVAASDQNDQMAWFSNYGTVNVDVAAPGVRIYSLDNGRQTLWSDNFNDGLLNGWTTGGSGDAWEIADPPAAPGAPALGSSPSASYSNNADTWAMLPTQNLSSASASLLTFRIIGSSETYADYLRLEVSTNGSTWTALQLKVGSSVYYPGITGSLPYWMTALADLGPWDGDPQLYLRLRFSSNAATNGAGFFIDDMSLTTADATDSYQYMQGTSMAAGYVSGLAALIQSEDDTLSPQEIKTIITGSVDLDQNFLEQVASGGRVNAYNALTLLRELSLSANAASSSRVQLSWSSAVALDALVTIQRRVDGQTTFSTIGQVDANITNYDDNGVSAETIYFYRVQAQTLAGASGYSNQTLASTITATGSSVAGSSGGGGGGGGCFIQSLGKW